MTMNSNSAPASATERLTWELIIPFLRPLETLLRDPDVTDIVRNGDSRVFVEKAGRMQDVPGIQIPEKSLEAALRNIARLLGDDLNEERPILDARLPDQSRLCAILAPVSLGGITLAIRKFQNKRYNVQELVRVGTLPDDVLAHLRSALRERRNVLIAGSTGAGKTTLMNALLALVDDEERLVVIEDTAELELTKPNVVRLEARREQPDLPPVSIRALVHAALRLRPDRILLGEVRAHEAFDLLQAMNTGHEGTLATIHANDARSALSRFATCVMMAGIDLPYYVVREQIAASLHLVVHLKRTGGGKRVANEVVRVLGYNAATNQFDLETLYAHA